MVSALPVLLLLMQDPQVSAYVNRIAHKLLASADVTLQSDAKVRARPEPGGILVSNGLFVEVRNEAELAGILAHELAHSTLGTPCIRLDKTDSKDPNDRDREHTADQTAIGLLTKAGYNPAAMLEFFSRYRREKRTNFRKVTRPKTCFSKSCSSKPRTTHSGTRLPTLQSSIGFTAPPDN